MFRTCVVALAFHITVPLFAQPQVGGMTCSNSTLTGPYLWLLTGSIAISNQAMPAAELARIVADGRGTLTGSAFDVVGGVSSTHTIAGTYEIQSSCSGTFVLRIDSGPPIPVTFQMTNGGRTAVMAFSLSNAVLTGTLYRQSSDPSMACTTSSISGSYGYLMVGSANNSPFSDAGNVISDGVGNLAGRSTANLGGSVSTLTATGPYTMSSNCIGTARLVDQFGNVANYVAGMVNDGQGILFLANNPGSTVSGFATSVSTAPQLAVTNGASFAPQRVAPGSLFSVFGTGFSQQSVSASSLPLPSTLGSAQLLVNGTAIPLQYVSPNQINAQLPFNTPNAVVSVLVNSGGRRSNVASLNVLPAAPGVFTFADNRAVVQNPDGSINSSTAPARPGDVLVAYLTGGGLVNASGPLVSGGPSPNGASPVTSPYTLTVGGQSTQTSYLGLTPGFVGLYQANFVVPQVSEGEYPLVISVGNVSSNGPQISIRR